MYTYGIVNSIFVEIQPDSTNIKMTYYPRLYKVNLGYAKLKYYKLQYIKLKFYHLFRLISDDFRPKVPKISKKRNLVSR